MRGCPPKRALPLALALLLCGLARASRPGCPADAESAAQHRALAQHASAVGDPRAAAAELWGAWCGGDDPSVLVDICEAHVAAQDCARGREIAAYARRRVRGPERLRLRHCRSRLERVCGGAAAPVQAKAPPAAPAAGGGAAEARASHLGQTGSLRVVVSGPMEGARFFVDDLEYARLDMVASDGVQLPAGPRRLVVQKDGREEFSRLVELSPRGTTVVFVPLSQPRQ